MDISRICPQCLDANPSDRSTQADVLFRKEPDEEEEQEEEEDDRKEDKEEDDEDEDTDDGYSE